MHDGFELVKMAEEVYAYLTDASNCSYLNEWTIYLFPCLNPDGLMDGNSHDGPGRCTTHYYADNNHAPDRLLDGKGDIGIDMNRCFDSNFPHTKTVGRHFTTDFPFAAKEANLLTTALTTIKDEHDTCYLIDNHGWTEQIIEMSEGKKLTQRFSPYFSSNSCDDMDDGEGYLARWAKDEVKGLNMTATLLFEFPGDAGKEINGIWNRGYNTKYKNAIKDILEEL